MTSVHLIEVSPADVFETSNSPLLSLLDAKIYKLLYVSRHCSTLDKLLKKQVGT